MFDRQTLTSLSSNSTTANPARAAPAASPEATQVCFDFAKGRCARPACRFLHEGGVSERAPLGLTQVCESPPVSSLCMPAPAGLKSLARRQNRAVGNKRTVLSIEARGMRLWNLSGLLWKSDVFVANVAPGEVCIGHSVCGILCL